jgi:2-C-methyl-D-erythritol 4-phosphate cytidylyltransferase
MHYFKGRPSMTPPKISVILLAGGVGTRMKAPSPKQFLLHRQKPIALHSFELFHAMPEIAEIIVVCDPLYRHHFPCSSMVSFAHPGERRQDSVYNGLQEVSPSADLVCIHDSARPLITDCLTRRVIAAAQAYGAAAAAMPIKFTIKECESENFVIRTPNRAHYWEIQTPQVISHSLLKEGFELAKQSDLTVTDDVSLVELLNKPVKLVEGSYQNIKITTQEDLHIAQVLDA